jgi:N-methylhydantoinase A/oxoprolinase/acetone carboxylase beta subunit
VKPRLIRHPLAAAEPPPEAVKGTRPVYQKGHWHDAAIYRMESMLPGNRVDGLAVIEASNTTLFVPADWQVRIDEYNIYWMTRKGA